MSLKSILVHVAHEAQHAVRLELALKLARQHAATIDALYVTTPLFGLTGAGRAASAVVCQEARLAAKRHAQDVRLEFERAVKEAGISHRWFEVDGEPLDELEHQAHLADVAIVSQSQPEFLEDHIRAQIPESLVMLAGCPILLLPRDYKEAGRVGENALIAWNTDPHAVRAIRESLPLLEKARKVSVLTVGPDGEQGIRPSEVIAYLGRQGISAKAIIDPGDPEDAGQCIIRRAQEIGADLIVMGCYGHSRWRELLFGGTTRTVFTKSPIPVFASN